MNQWVIILTIALLILLLLYVLYYLFFRKKSKKSVVPVEETKIVVTEDSRSHQDPDNSATQVTIANTNPNNNLHNNRMENKNSDSISTNGNVVTIQQSLPPQPFIPRQTDILISSQQQVALPQATTSENMTTAVPEIVFVNNHNLQTETQPIADVTTITRTDGHLFQQTMQLSESTNNNMSVTPNTMIEETLVPTLSQDGQQQCTLPVGTPSETVNAAASQVPEGGTRNTSVRRWRF